MRFLNRMGIGASKISKKVVLSVLVATGSSAFADIETMATVKELDEVITTLDAQFGAQNVLIVTDLDNTLLEFERDIGSEHWFLWQNAQIGSASNDLAMASSMANLLKLQSIIMTGMPVHLVAPEMKRIYNTHSQNGGSMIALTSRGIDTRDMTYKSIQTLGLSFIERSKALHLDQTKNAVDSTGLIFDPKQPEWAHLTTEILAQQKVTTTKPVAYQHGILLTDGQNKGVMLAAFLARRQAPPPKAVIFLDDRSHHVKAVSDVMAKAYPEIETRAINLTVSRPAVEKFEKSDKAAVRSEQCLWFRAFSSMWPRSNAQSPLNPQFGDCSR
jgi:hypothetical protein